MRRRVALATLAGALASVARGRDLPEAQKAGALRVIVWKDNLPELFAVSEGSSSGLEKEVLAGFTRVHRLRMDVVAVDSLDDRLPALLDGRGDVVAGGLVNTEQRRKLVDFTSEIFPIRHLVVTRKPHARVQTLDALRALKVGTIKGSSWAEEVKRANVPPANVTDTYGSADELIQALRAGTVAAIVMSAVWAVVEQKKDPALELGTFLGPPTSVGFAVRRADVKLRAALDEHLDSMRRSPAWSRLVIQYFGENGLEILRKSRAE